MESLLDAEAQKAASVTRYIQVALLTGGIDKPYAFGLATALDSQDVRVDFIGSDEVDAPEFHQSPRLTFLNLRGDQREDADLPTKVKRISLYYARLIRYAAVCRPRIFHILWNNKFEIFDRTILLLYYKLLGKKLVLTAHNVNAGKRDHCDSWLNRLTLRIQYGLGDHIFVHTEKMKAELSEEFDVPSGKVTVIPLGINNSAPHTHLTREAARKRLGIGDREKAILFFGSIGPYKGLDCLTSAFLRLAAADPSYRLIIAGRPKAGHHQYLIDALQPIRSADLDARLIQRLDFIPDEETEIYFKAADVVALPYTEVAQSGVLILAFSFGIPVVASRVGSLQEDVTENRNGYLCQPGNPTALADAIARFFASDLYTNFGRHRPDIERAAASRYSWTEVAAKTVDVYSALARGCEWHSAEPPTSKAAVDGRASEVR
jgi:glycosyltransferase involved in cell wall biosynthesis